MKKGLTLALIIISQSAMSSYKIDEIDRYKAIYSHMIKKNISNPKCTIKIKGYKEKNSMKVYSIEAIKGSQSDCEEVLQAVVKTKEFPLPKNESLSNKLLETIIYID
ncbi:cell envelope integrity protein TolA [Vibrio splendidus]